MIAAPERHGARWYGNSIHAVPFAFQFRNRGPDTAAFTAGTVRDSLPFDYRRFSNPSAAMGSNHFLLLLACFLCLVLSTIVVKQAALDAERTPTYQAAETAPPPPAADPIRL